MDIQQDTNILHTREKYYNSVYILTDMACLKNLFEKPFSSYLNCNSIIPSTHRWTRSKMLTASDSREIFNNYNRIQY